MKSKSFQNKKKYKLLTTIGDINGIGVETFIKAVKKISKTQIANKTEFTLIGNINLIQQYCKNLFTDLNFDKNDLMLDTFRINIININTKAQLKFGKIDYDAGLLAKNTLYLAVELMLKNQFDALITLPVSKEALKLANWNFPGQTEMLGYLSNSVQPLMILCNNKIRVTLATIHTSIKNVPNEISKEKLTKTIISFNYSLQKDFSISKPKIAVLGLNPHCGENSLFGKEEEQIIIPAINSCKLTINVFGPFPADGFFAFNEYKKYDGIIAMYHDQGLIPLKLLTKGTAVNFTAGLPFVRTSPDHGTAFHIAGKNIADEKSTLNAILLAIDIVKSRSLTQTKL